MNILDKIKTVPFAPQHFVNEKTNKRQIYLHHTASSPNPYGVIKWWEHTSERVATSFVIGGFPGQSSQWKDGDIIQLFNTSKWAWHLGLKPEHLKLGGSTAKSNKILNSQSIGIELCNWGFVKQTPDGFRNYLGGRVPDWEVVELDVPYRNYKFYQRYTPSQLENTMYLLRFLCDKWDIPKTFNSTMFTVSPAALQGESGIWTHSSVRPDKWDCFPQKELISMLSAV